jgi:hypothetical protein
MILRCTPFCAAGILVLNAREGGPAWRAGIRGTSRDEYGRLVLGDIITAINGTKVRNSSDLYKVLDKSMVSALYDCSCNCGAPSFSRVSWARGRWR